MKKLISIILMVVGANSFAGQRFNPVTGDYEYAPDVPVSVEQQMQDLPECKTLDKTSAAFTSRFYQNKSAHADLPSAKKASFTSEFKAREADVKKCLDAANKFAE